MKFAPIVMILFLPVWALSATFVQTTQLALPAEGIYELRIHCGAGSLYVTNAEWRDEITVF
ncbi:MAG: hypothetical protein JRF47_17260, partial [Deltaproteobacteria bacterium]|nr:hypothetical protein [Deltaproteobacteria bacterium]